MKRSTVVLLLCAVAGTLGFAGGGSASAPECGSGTSAALAAAARGLERRDDGERAREGDDGGDRDDGARLAYFQTVLNELRDVPALAPLFERYGVPAPIAYEEGAAGLAALLHAVRIRSSSGTLTVTNRETGGVIFAAPLWDLPSGLQEPEHLPGAPIPSATRSSQ